MFNSSMIKRLYKEKKRNISNDVNQEDSDDSDSSIEEPEINPLDMNDY